MLINMPFCKQTFRIVLLKIIFGHLVYIGNFFEKILFNSCQLRACLTYYVRPILMSAEIIESGKQFGNFPPKNFDGISACLAGCMAGCLPAWLGDAMGAMRHAAGCSAAKTLNAARPGSGRGSAALRRE